MMTRNLAAAGIGAAALCACSFPSGEAERRRSPTRSPRRVPRRLRRARPRKGRSRSRRRGRHRDQCAGCDARPGAGGDQQRVLPPGARVSGIHIQGDGGSGRTGHDSDRDALLSAEAPARSPPGTATPPGRALPDRQRRPRRRGDLLTGTHGERRRDRRPAQGACRRRHRRPADVDATATRTRWPKGSPIRRRSAPISSPPRPTGVALSYGELSSSSAIVFSRPKMRALCAMLGDGGLRGRGARRAGARGARRPPDRRPSRPGLVGRRRGARRAAMRAPGKARRRGASSTRSRRKPSPSGSPETGQGRTPA